MEDHGRELRGQYDVKLSRKFDTWGGEEPLTPVKRKSLKKKPLMKTPVSILPHSKDYHNRAWEDYDLHELGWWVHLLAKRATHRENKRKRAKDLHDAQNYLNMMQAHLDAKKSLWKIKS